MPDAEYEVSDGSDDHGDQSKDYGTGLSISLNEICFVLSFAANVAWFLLIIFNEGIRAFDSQDPTINQIQSIALLAGLIIWFLLSAIHPLLVRRIVASSTWFVCASIVAMVCSILFLFTNDSQSVWFVVRLVARVLAGFISGSFFIFFVNELEIMATKNIMVVSATGMIVAILLFLVVGNLTQPVSYLVVIALPLVSAAASKVVLGLNSGLEIQSAKKRYARMTLFERLDEDEKSNSDVPLLSRSDIISIREKTLGLVNYGFSAGAACGVLFTSVVVLPRAGGFDTSAIFLVELLLAAGFLGISLRIFSVRYYLRLPQWSYYLIAILSFLLIPLTPSLLRIILSGLIITAIIYFFTVDITVIAKMGQDMIIDPRRGFGWYEGFFFAAGVVGWLTFILLYRFSNDGSEQAFTLTSTIVIALIASSMSLMRWMYYDLVSKDSKTTHSGEWRRRCEKMGRDYSLTRRETEILELLVRGRSINYIKDQFVVSTSTVKTHVYNIYCKIGVHSRQDLIDLFEKSRERKSR